MIKPANTDIPVNQLRRSQLYRWHINHNAQFIENEGATIVNHYSSRKHEEVQMHKLGLIDLSLLAKTGIKGTGAPSWLISQKGQLPEKPNSACLQQDGSLVAQLSHNELLILSGLKQQDNLVKTIDKQWSLDNTSQTYLLPYNDSHCWFALVGEHAETVLSKICAIDMRLSQFQNLEIAQTSVARVNSIVIRHDHNDLACFYILSDVSSAEFLWSVILDAMLEFEGEAIGLDALIQLSE